MEEIKNKIKQALTQQFPQKKYAEIISDFVRKTLAVYPFINCEILKDNCTREIAQVKSEAKRNLISEVYEVAIKTLEQNQLTEIAGYKRNDIVFNVLKGQKGRITFICNDKLVFLDENNRPTPVAYLRKQQAEKTEITYSQKKTIFDRLKKENVKTPLKDFLDNFYRDRIAIHPFCSRELFWASSQKKAYIEAFFNKAATTSIVMIALSDEEFKTTGYDYEILDGKQQLTTILEFIEGKFPIFGKVFFENLTEKDIQFFFRQNIDTTIYSSRDNEALTKEQRGQLFLSINFYHAPQGEETENRERASL